MADQERTGGEDEARPETEPETQLQHHIRESIERIWGNTRAAITQLRLENRGHNTTASTPESPTFPLSSTFIGHRRGSTLDLLSPTTQASTVSRPPTVPNTPIQEPRARMTGQIVFNGTFSGLPGEDPLEYVEDIEIFGKKCEPTDEQARRKEMQVAFRQGLRGQAKAKWYLQLSSENRKWDSVKPLFEKRFKIREADVGRGIGTRVFNLKRRPTESIRDFVNRAAELSYQCTDEQMQELRYRLYAHLVVPEGHHDFEQDCRVQERVSDRLFGLGKMSGDGVMTKDCEFEDVRGCILGCIRRPGTEDEDEVRAVPEEAMTSEEITLQTTKVLRDIVQEVARIRETPRSVTGRSPNSPGSNGQRYPELTYTAQPSGNSGNQTSRQVGFAPVQDVSSGTQREPYKPPQTRENWGWQRYRGGSQRGGFQASGRGGGYGGQSSYGPNNHSAASSNYSSWTCFNCGNKGHGSTACPHEFRSSAIRREIQDLIQKGEPIPDRLRVTETQQPHAVVEIREDDDQLPSAVASMSFADPLFPNKTTWDEWKRDPDDWTRPSIPALPAAAKRARTDERQDEDDHVVEVNPSTPPRTSAPRPRADDTPHPRREGLEKVEKGREALLRLKDQLKVTLDSKGKKKDTIPVRLFSGDEGGRFNIREWMQKTNITLTVGQLLDRSPQIRAQLQHELGHPDRGLRGRKSKRVPSKRRTQSVTADLLSAVGRIAFKDQALPDTKTTYLAYTTGTIKDVEVDRILVDDGSLGELVGPALVDRLGLRRCEVGRPMFLKMADDSSTPIKHYAMIPVVVGGILTVVQAYVTGQNQIYDLLLGRSWLIRNRATHEYGTDILTLRGTDGHVAAVQLRPRGVGRDPPSGTVGEESASSEGDSDDEYSSDSSEGLGNESGREEPDTLLSLVDETELLDILEYLENDSSGLGLGEPKNA